MFKFSEIIADIEKIPKRFHYIYSLLVIFLIVLLFTTYQRDLHNTSSNPIPCTTPTHQYTNPELDCINTDLAYQHIRTSEEETRTFIEKEVSSGHASRISVFFRDIHTKRWYGINENESFSPGSIMKLPLAIAYFKYEEFDPSINKIAFTLNQPNDLNSLEHFNSAKPLVVGEKYTVNDFITRLLTNSDNAVIPILLNGIDKDFYNKVLIDLGVIIPLSEYGGTHADFFSAKSYAAIFRLLYNASYLNIEQSESVLKLLSQSTFSEGLVAGVPSGVNIAHKFGEATQIDPNTNQLIKRELHDCGIVYHKDSPYILCVMTEGKDFDSLKKTIATISKITWDTNMLTSDEESSQPINR